MILVVDEQIFQSNDVSDLERFAFIRLAKVRDHTILTRSAPGPKVKPSNPDPVTQWCDELRGGVKKETRECLEQVRRMPMRSAAVGAHRILVSNRWPSVHGNCLLTMPQALRLLGEPLHVLVENGLRDAAFLRRAMPSDWREKISEWEKNGWIRFDQAGGISELEQIVRFMIGRGAEQTWGIPAEGWKAIHFFVFDHDGDTPSTPSDQSKKLHQKLSARCHMLERRNQEHYLPREVMNWIADSKITDPVIRPSVKDSIEAFFGDPARRTHGSLPVSQIPGAPKDTIWKHQFFLCEMQSKGWEDAWFQRDGSWPEMVRLAEAIQRAM